MPISSGTRLGSYEILIPLGTGGLHDAVFGGNKSSWCKNLPTMDFNNEILVYKKNVGESTQRISFYLPH